MKIYLAVCVYEDTNTWDSLSILGAALTLEDALSLHNKDRSSWEGPLVYSAEPIPTGAYWNSRDVVEASYPEAANDDGYGRFVWEVDLEVPLHFSAAMRTLILAGFDAPA